MDYFFDTLFEPLMETVLFVMVAVGIVVGARTVVADLTRRRRIRELAETRQWRFLGYVPSDGRDPYTRFEQVSWAVLLRYVVEGRERGFDFSVFEYCARRRIWNTGALIQLDVAPLSCRVEFWKSGGGSFDRGLEEANEKIGPRTAAALRKARGLLDSLSLDGLVVEIGSGALLARAEPSPLEADEIPALLDAALSLSAAVVDDERSASRARHS